MRILILALLLLSFGWPSAANAQQGPRCGKYTEIRAALYEAYKEVPRVVGIDGRGAMIQILAAKSGSWTLLKVTPQGIACYVAGGEALQILEHKDPEIKPREQTL